MTTRKIKPNHWRWVLFALGAVALIAIGAQLWNRRPETLVIATAQPGSVAHDVALQFAEIVARESRDLRLEVLPSAGSVENLRLLQAREVDLAIAQADVPAGPDARLMVLLFSQLFHIIVRDSIEAESFADLAGLRLGVPAVDSGGYQSLQGLLAYYQLGEQDFAAFEHLSSQAMIDAFNAGEVDALFLVGLIGHQVPTEILRGGNARLLPLAQGDAMRLTQPFLETVIIPKGAYNAAPPQPAEDLPTVAVESLLLAHEAVRPAHVQELTGLLFDFRSELAVNTPAIMGMLNPLEASSTTVAVHPGAESFYLRDEPSFLERRADFIALLITLATLGFSALYAVRAWYRSRGLVSIEALNREMLAMIESVPSMQAESELQRAEKRLVEILKRVVDDLDNEGLDPAAVEAFMLTWNHAVETIRHQQSLVAETATSDAKTAGR